MIGDDMIKSLRWFARSLTIFVIAFHLLSFFGDRYSSSLTMLDITKLVLWGIILTGMVVAWKSERIGGFMIIGGTVVQMLINPQSLQMWAMWIAPIIGALFLFCWAKSQKDGSHAMKNLLLLVALSLTLSSFSCEVFERATPIPKEKEAFIGVWLSQSGYKLHIKAAGTATITQLVNSHDPDFDTLNIKVAPPIIEDIPVKFKTDSILMVIKPLAYAKEFRIDRYPYRDGDSSKIVLNGVTLIKKL